MGNEVENTREGEVENAVGEVGSAVEGIERIGVFGGTFDPPHVGHIAAAEAALAALQLDRVVFVVSNVPWQKVEGGKVTHRVSTDQGAFACMLGGTLLHILTCSTSDPETCRKERSGRIEVVEAPYAGAGWP